MEFRKSYGFDTLYVIAQPMPAMLICVYSKLFITQRVTNTYQPAPANRQQPPALPPIRFSHTLKGMEVHFTPEQEAQLSQMATHAGIDAERLVKDAALRLLQQEARFLAAVDRGIAAAERGEFIEEDEMDARLEAMLKA